jgi:hypothetical protein
MLRHELWEPPAPNIVAKIWFLLSIPYNPGMNFPNTTTIAAKAITKSIIQLSGCGTPIQSNRNLTNMITTIVTRRVKIIVMAVLPISMQLAGLQ